MSFVVLFGDEFNPRQFFTANEQGIWLDPSDFSTLYQDAAGTTPVTAVGQPVGLALDKRLGLALGAELVSNPGPFTATAGWTGSAAALSVSAGALVVTNSIGGTFAKAQGSIATVAGKFYSVQYTAGAHTSATAGALWIGTSVGGNQLLALSGTNGTRKTAVFLAQGTTTYIQFIGSSVLGETVSATLGSIKEIAGNHATQSTAGNRPVLRQDSNGLYYLEFDGATSNRWLQTASINFTGTDKMTVWAGVRKESDAAAGDVFGTYVTTSSNGSFLVGAPRTAAGNYGFLVRGDSANSQYSANGFTSPVTNVLSASFDIGGATLADEVKPRVNGSIPVLAGAAAGPAGGGNFANLPLYIGRRGGTSASFNGRLYQLIIRGAESNAGQIAAGEAWCNGKTRAY